MEIAVIANVIRRRLADGVKQSLGILHDSLGDCFVPIKRTGLTMTVLPSNIERMQLEFIRKH
jgi:hypothetical protein